MHIDDSYILLAEYFFKKTFRWELQRPQCVAHMTTKSHISCAVKLPEHLVSAFIFVTQTV